MSTPHGRILRIGIVHDNRIVEERLFRKPGRVTIGQGPENTFVYPLPGFPRSHELLSYASGAYAFVFPPGLAGKVSTAEDIFDLDELVQSGRARPWGAFHRYPLADDARGKVLLGDLTLLFQFVTPPPPVPRLQLPAAARIGWARRLDLGFAACLAASFVLLGVPSATLHAWYEARGQYLASTGKTSRVLHELEAEIALRPARVTKPEEPQPTVAEATNDAPAPVREATPAATRPAPPPRKAERARGNAVAATEGPVDAYKKRLEHVRARTLLKYVSAGAEGGDEGPLAVGVHADQIREAWSFAGGAETATADSVAEFVGAPRLGAYVNGPETRRPPGRIATREVEAPVKRPEVAIRLKINGELGEQLGHGRVDKSSVADVFKRRQGALRHCYEKRLKLNPALAGRVRVMFTIGPAGRATSVQVNDNSSGDAELGRCVADRIREWPFPRPSGGPVTFVHTLVLTSG